jgi:transcriptional regulator with PAS, ATPase and Fis domain
MKKTDMETLKRRIGGELNSEYCIYGRSHAVQKICDIIKKVSRSASTVLILGESGTGKELVASAIHLNSARAAGPFIKINCAALNDNLLESELFGYARGAFTGAYADRAGKFEAASGGTIFLDEIGDISPAMQAKLLRVLQEKEFERVGETRTRKSDVRVICATNRDLSEMVDAGEFRLDLYYRLNVLSVYLPSLKERRDDIAGLVNFFIRKYNERENREIKGVSEEVMAKLKNHEWPGNVRELENVIEAAAVMAQGDVIENVWLHNKSKRPVILSRPVHDAVSLNHDYMNTNASPGAAGLISGERSRITRGSSSADEDGGGGMDYVSKVGGHFPISGAPVQSESFDGRQYYEKQAGRAKNSGKKSGHENAGGGLNGGADLESAGTAEVVIRIPCTLEDAETAVILKTLETAGGNKTRAAKLLAISLRSLQLKLKKIRVADEF